MILLIFAIEFTVVFNKTEPKMNRLICSKSLSVQVFHARWRAEPKFDPSHPVNWLGDSGQNHFSAHGQGVRSTRVSSEQPPAAILFCCKDFTDALID